MERVRGLAGSALQSIARRVAARGARRAGAYRVRYLARALARRHARRARARCAPAYGEGGGYNISIYIAARISILVWRYLRACLAAALSARLIAHLWRMRRGAAPQKPYLHHHISIIKYVNIYLPLVRMSRDDGMRKRKAQKRPALFACGGSSSSVRAALSRARAPSFANSAWRRRAGAEGRQNIVSLLSWRRAS